MSQTDETLADAMRTWNQGQQEPAISMVKPLADEGDPASLLLICWFLHQLGQPRVRDGIPYARQLGELGNPWVLQFYFSLLADDSETRSDAAAMIASTPTRGVGTNDPIGRAVSYAIEGDTNNATVMLRAAAAPAPWTTAPDIEEVRQRLSQIDQAVTNVGERQQIALSAIQTASQEVEIERENFNTRSKTLTELLNNLTNASAQSHFDKQAKTYEKESSRIWLLGVFVLFIAAMAAFLPVVLNYVTTGHRLHDQSNVSAHLGAAVALAAVAGVLLARARNRDRARQRNSDLSVALGTMFAYSEQISNQEAKERFKHDMGRLVLETFLQQQPPTEDGSRSVLSEILSSRGSNEQLTS